MPIIRLIRQTEEICSDLIGKYDHVVISISDPSHRDLNKECGTVFTILQTFGKEYKFEYFQKENGQGYLDCKKVSLNDELINDTLRKGTKLLPTYN